MSKTPAVVHHSSPRGRPEPITHYALPLNSPSKNDRVQQEPTDIGKAARGQVIKARLDLELIGAEDIKVAGDDMTWITWLSGITSVTKEHLDCILRSNDHEVPNLEATPKSVLIATLVNISKGTAACTKYTMGHLQSLGCRILIALLGPLLIWVDLNVSVSKYMSRRSAAKDSARRPPGLNAGMFGFLFDIWGSLVVLLLTICTCSYLRPRFGNYLHPKSPGFPGMFGRFAVIGDRLSPWVSLACIAMFFVTLFMR